MEYVSYIPKKGNKHKKPAVSWKKQRKNIFT